MRKPFAKAAPLSPHVPIRRSTLADTPKPEELKKAIAESSKGSVPIKIEIESDEEKNKIQVKK